MAAKESHVRRLLLLSSSCLHGCEPFEYAKAEIENFFGSGVKEILFVPYALKDYAAYTQKVRDRFGKIGLQYKVTGIHEETHPAEAVKNAQAIFIGGGNTFRLLNSLHHLSLIPLIQKRVLEETRDDRITEYLELDPKYIVLGLKEGAWLRVEGDQATLGGTYGGRLFSAHNGDSKVHSTDIAPGTDVSYLLRGQLPPEKA
ncbi:putative Alpha-aspartyl dipeptidase [Hypsibius exemplaris]|uniref:Alpha-aspartyl dipeptidase n=1 Tax=Hypsibius exemplaris TaxID=2072580 RepID=A0A9X6NC98_HYPEX|nr:putative Alpha-aspartyl dipeptidase [Hypsibius exemplaris]